MDDIRRWRRALHQIPEIGLKEEKTASYLRQEISKMGYQYEIVFNTGTTVFIDNGCQETIAFRSDIDALMIKEENEEDYVSNHLGYMHACGHDGHMAALLGFLKKLKESKEHFSYNILCIFQPAEESPGGARYIVESGVLDHYHVKAIFGMHLMPFIEEGYIACKSGALMAMCGELDVKIIGKGTHAGLPQNGIDSIIIATQAIQQYQTLVSRMVSPFSPIILNVGTIDGGTMRNGVAQETTMTGTLRCYDELLYKELLESLDCIHKGLEKSYGCQIEWTCPPNYPPVINDENLYKKFINIIKQDDFIELNEAMMLSEDFSFYQKEVPGIFFYLGTKSDQYSYDLHTSRFNFNEDVLKKVVDVYYRIALHL